MSSEEVFKSGGCQECHAKEIENLKLYLKVKDLEMETQRLKSDVELGKWATKMMMAALEKAEEEIKELKAKINAC